VLVFAALGLGLAIPFIAIAFIPPLRRRLPAPGQWMKRLQRFLAIPMGATAVAALWLLYRQGGGGVLFDGLVVTFFLAALLGGLGVAQRGHLKHGWIWVVLIALLVPLALVSVWQRPSARTTAVAGTEVWSPDAVRQVLAQGHPVLVYFTADWCLTCKVNEAAAIDRKAVRDAFDDAGVRVLAGDWTSGDPAITRFLESRGRAGVPLYLWYEPGRAEPEELPQVLTPSMLISRAQRQR
jgi:thiol:disulfide interchange protein